MPILNKKNRKQVSKYNKFVREYDGASFMQDLAWGDVKSNWTEEAVYLEEKGKIVATMSILIQRVKKLRTTMMYAPRRTCM